MKMLRIQVIITYLCLIAPIAKGQQNTGSEQATAPAQSLNLRQLMVQWDSGVFPVTQTWTSAVTAKYQHKIDRFVLVPSFSNAIMVHFKEGNIKEEDLLQVLEMEGVPSPYFITNGRKYMLGQDKYLVNEPVK